MRTMISFGLIACSSAGASCMSSSTPGRKLSTRICADLASSRTMARPASERRSSATLFLLRLLTFHAVSSPLTRHERKVSPSGGSTLITSAPKSASCKVSTLPATRRDRSITRTPFRGPRASGVKLFLEGRLANVLAEKLQRARHGLLGGRGVVAAALVAMEAVIGRVIEDLHLGMELPELVHMRHRDVHVLVAEMQLGRDLRLLALQAMDAAAVIARHGVRPEPGRGQPGDGA